MNEIFQDAIEQIRDSINSLGPRIAQIVEYSSPTPYVTKNLEISEISLLVAIIAAVIGLVGTFYGFLGYRWSKETARNVAHIGIDAQFSIADDFIQELYRRIVLAAAIRLNNGKAECNAMSSLKLPAFSDYFKEDDYKTKAETYRILLEIKQRAIDYNNMINICISHLERNSSLSDKEIRELERKPAKIMRQVIKICEQIAGNKEYGIRTLQRLAILHTNHMEKDGYPDLESLRKFLKNKYENSEFTETLSSICERYKHFPSVLLDILKHDVQTSSHSAISTCYPFTESFTTSTVRQKDVVNWFNFSLSVDGAASIPRIS